MKTSKPWALGLAVGATLWLGTASPSRALDGAYTHEKNDDAIVIRRGGQEVLRYQLRPDPQAGLPVQTAGYFHPLTTPSGTVVTDLAPSDHKHHRGVFLAWVAMDGATPADFWGWGELAPIKGRQVLNRQVSDLRTTGGATGFSARNDWVAESDVFLREKLDATFRDVGGAHVLDLSYTLSAPGDITIRQTAFSGFCVRASGKTKIEAHNAAGLVTLPDPAYDKPETGWPAERWYAYTWASEGSGLVGVAVIDHPSNPPSLWHNHRDVRMLNPCIAAPGKQAISAEKPLSLRYTVVAFDGTIPAELLSRLSRP